MNSDHYERLTIQKIKMLSYLKLKLEQDDLHGVADAAMDIRELDAQLKLLELLEREDHDT